MVIEKWRVVYNTLRPHSALWRQIQFHGPWPYVRPQCFTGSDPVLGEPQRETLSSRFKKLAASFRRRRHHSLEHELLGPAVLIDFRRVEVAVRICRHVVENVELAGLIARPTSK